MRHRSPFLARWEDETRIHFARYSLPPLPSHEKVVKEVAQTLPREKGHHQKERCHTSSLVAVEEVDTEQRKVVAMCTRTMAEPLLLLERKVVHD